MLDYLYENNNKITELIAESDLEISNSGIYKIITKNNNNFTIKKNIDVIIFEDNPSSNNIIIESGSVVDYFSIIIKDNSITKKFINHGQLNTYFIDLSNESKLTVKTILNENNASLVANTIIYADKTNQKKYNLTVEHALPNTNSNFYNYGVITDSATLKINIESLIKKGMNKSNAYQKTKVISLSNQAKAYLNPILYIDEFDIAAGHGASFGQISDNDIYYMKSRGINTKEAKQILALGNLMINIPKYMQKEITNMLIERFNNE